MLPLQKIIVSKLKEISEIANQSQFFDINITKVTKLPVTICRFVTISEKDKVRNDVILEIDIWQQITDITVSNAMVTLETITNKIDKKLNRLQYASSDLCFVIYRLEPYKFYLVDDKDPTIKRRQLRYVCHTFIK